MAACCRLRGRGRGEEVRVGSIVGGDGERRLGSGECRVLLVPVADLLSKRERVYAVFDHVAVSCSCAFSSHGGIVR